MDPHVPSSMIKGWVPLVRYLSDTERDQRSHNVELCVCYVEMIPWSHQRFSLMYSNLASLVFHVLNSIHLLPAPLGLVGRRSPLLPEVVAALGWRILLESHCGPIQWCLC